MTIVSEASMKKVQKRRNRIKIGILLVAVFLLGIFLVAMPAATVIVYESVFSRRYQPASWTKFEVSDFPGLTAETCSFPSNRGQSLAGYCYSKEGQAVKGVVVLSHGLGCGGQNTMMPFADFFTSRGYLVFAYDATGNDESEGDSVEGLPQGVADLDYALRFVKSHPRYVELPIFLLGHSWGAYSAGAVLNLHPHVSAVVLIAGPNRSVDLMARESENIVGPLGNTGVPYLMLYEWIKFGSYASYSVLDGFENSEAQVLIVQSMDDSTVPPDIGYDKFREAYGDDPRFSFFTYEDRGHDRLYYSRDAEVFREQLNADYLQYVEEHGKEHGEAVKTEFFAQYPHWKRCFELDSELMEEICLLFEESITNETKA